jgi:hypothetical protein
MQDGAQRFNNPHAIFACCDAGSSCIRPNMQETGLAVVRRTCPGEAITATDLNAIGFLMNCPRRLAGAYPSARKAEPQARSAGRRDFMRARWRCRIRPVGSVSASIAVSPATDSQDPC